MNRRIHVPLLCILVAFLPALRATAADEKKVRIVLAGDSTVTDNAGWGKGFAKCLTDDVELVNLSRGGRSSRSFIAEGSWKKVLDLKPDYVLIQFGHNDQPGHGPERETDPQTTYRQYMTQYVDEARTAGIKPVLVTSLSRRQWGSDGKIHSTLQPNVDVVKQIAAEKKVPLVDLHAHSIELYEKLGREAVNKLSPKKTPKLDKAEQGTAADALDGTHLNARGSEVVGPIVAEELKKAVPELAAYLKTPTDAKTITVAADGSGDFKTIQEAVAAAPEKSAERTVIRIKPGTYQGPVVVPKGKPNLAFEGDDAETTIITYDKNVNDPIPPGVDKFNPAVQIQADGFLARNLTIRNTSGDHGQALALRIDSDRVVLDHCRLLGWQDTLMLNNARQYLHECYIEGRVDFIYGSGTAVFDHCTIHSKNGGYVTAASTPQDRPFGFVFLDCKLTGDAVPWTAPDGTQPAKPAKPNKLTYLGRPWRPYGSVAFIRCELGDHVRPEGWHNWGKVENEKTARYVEYGNTGPGAKSEQRVPWSKQLTKEEAAQITVEKVLGGNDGWKPEP